MTTSTTALLPYGEVQRRLGIVSQTYAGVRSIPLERIVGTLDRTVDFDRDFRPRSDRLAQRLAGLREAYPDGDFPAISVYEVGGAFFVVDGHHRVALSREMGRRFIDAEVIRVDTEYELGEGIDVLTVVHTQQHQRFLRESGLEVVLPDARFDVLRPDAYAALLGIVQAYAYRRSRAVGRLLEPPEVAAEWYTDEYQPAVAAMHDLGLHRRYPYKTDADLFLWVDARRRLLEPLQADVTWRQAAEAAVGDRHGPFARRRFTGQKRTPLTRRVDARSPSPSD